MNEKDMMKLNAYISEHVMGWEWYCALGNAFLIPPFAHERFDAFAVHWTKGIYEKGWTRTEPEKKQCKKLFNIECHYSDYDYCSIPRYTTDPAAAMEVLEKCARKTTNLEIDFRDDGLFGVGIYRGLNKLGAEADTLPLAICKFAQLLWEEKH